MKLYITKPEPWDVVAGGLDRISIWFERPTYKEGWRYQVDDWLLDKDPEGNAMTAGEWSGVEFNPAMPGTKLKGYLFRKHKSPEMQRIGQEIWSQVRATFVPLDDDFLLQGIMAMERAGRQCEKPGMSHKEWIGEIDVTFCLAIAAPAQAVTTVTNEMVGRFLGWKLPKDFGPDAGVSFRPTDLQLSGVHPWPTGTNVLNDPQARQMLEHVLFG